MSTAFLLSIAVLLVTSDVLRGQPAPRELAQVIRNRIKPARKPSEPAAGKNKTSRTVITIELLTGAEGIGLQARRWQEVLGKLDVTLTVRPGRRAEKVELTERKSGGLRTVQVKGVLDTRGRLIFPDQIFTENDTDKLAAWLDNLRTYGAEGNPDGRPAWGLTKEQFDGIYAALKRPLAFETRDVELDKALAKFELPTEYPLKFAADAARSLKQHNAAQVSQSLKGIAQGTALAVILGEQGLGFRPRRLPDGSVELTVVTREESGKTWPVGWPIRQNLPEAAPALFVIKPIELEDLPLDAILEAAAGVIGIPILIDRAGLTAKGVDLAEVKITFPARRTTWIEALKTFTFKAKSKIEVLTDEQGKPFVWVTPLQSPSRTPED